MRSVLVVNPTAGSGAAGRAWQRLRSHLPAEVEVLLETSGAATRERLAERLRAGCRRVLSFGGDGTANLVINVLLEEGLGGEVAFGIVPAGTASDFARHTGIPRDPRRALDHALHRAQASPIDAIAVEVEGRAPRYCLNIASAGLSGHVDQRVQGPRRGSYLIATLQALWTYTARPCAVEVDGKPFYDGPFFVLALANGRYFGKAMKVAPHAEIDDGLLDVVLVLEVPTWQLPYRLPQFYLGRHIDDCDVLTTRAREVRLRPGVDYPPYDLDGEPIPSAPATVRVLPDALRLLR
jgi:diacylglycerol kinase (ATP)